MHSNVWTLYHVERSLLDGINCVEWSSKPVDDENDVKPRTRIMFEFTALGNIFIKWVINKLFFKLLWKIFEKLKNLEFQNNF